MCRLIKTNKFKSNKKILGRRKIMFTYVPCAQMEHEDYFADINYSKNIECIIPTAELLINFRSNGLRAKKNCFVYAEKMDYKGLIQIRLTEKCDQRRMYITTVDASSFQELKQDQSLHVTFAGFIENLIRILQDCQSGKLEIQMVQQTESRPLVSAPSAPDEYQMQFVEMRPFKNLVHLCLPCRLAPLNVVLFYMNSILDAMQKKIAEQDHTKQQLQHEVNSQGRRIEQLGVENSKLRESMLENSRILNQRHAEELQKVQESLRKACEQRQLDNERSRKSISALQAQLERLGAEKNNIQQDKNKEQKRNETLNDELANTKTHLTHLRDQNEKLETEISALKNLERKTDMHLSDARKQVHELQEKLKKYDKAKADLVAELEAEKKISQTKRQALEMATAEISKANEIILKQSIELNKLKKTIDWRTEVALQQEKAINEKEKMLKLRDQEILHMQNTVENMRKEIPQELESMRRFANSLELKYSEQIKVLRQKLEPLEKENAPLTSNRSRR